MRLTFLEWLYVSLPAVVGVAALVSGLTLLVRAHRTPKPARRRLMGSALITVFALVLFVLLAGCRPVSGDEPASSETSHPLSGGAGKDTPGDRSRVPAGLRSAYVRARQAEGATDERFHVLRQAGVLAAHSPSRGVRARYVPSGIDVSSEAPAGQPSTRGVLNTSSLRCDGLRVATAAVPFTVGEAPHRVERVLGFGTLSATEWVESGPLGLEQGFDVSSASGCAELEVAVDVEGLSVSLDGDSARLSGYAGALRYAELFAVDADGRSLPARLGVRTGGLSLLVDTAGARFPVSVDPLVFVEDTRVGPPPNGLGSDGAEEDRFGASVSVSGDTALVGVYGDDVGKNADQGSAYVFLRVGGAWTLEAKLTAGDGAANDYFGLSVSVFGDTALVGASLNDVGTKTDQGSAYVFVRSGTTWTQQAKLTAGDGAAFDAFGSSVSVTGDTAVIGAFQDDVSTSTDQGSAYVFVRSGSAWTQQAKLTAGDGAANDAFGSSVSVSGDTALLGAHQDDIGISTNQGSAYVFVRTGTTWTQQAKLTAGDGVTADTFGYSVSVSGDTALVGAYWDNIGANTDQGSAYVFVRSGTSWSEQAKLTASDGAAFDYFGSSVSVSGDTAVVGAYFDDVGANVNQGSAYVFVRSGTAWTQQAKLTAGDGAANDSFGSSVSVSGDTTLAGAYADDLGANTNQGSTSVFVRAGTSWTQLTKLTAGEGSANDNFGFSVSLSGDTALVGVYRDDVGTNVDQGSAYVFVRSGTAWRQQARLTAGDGAAVDLFGLSVSLSGDTALVGAFGDDVGTNNAQGSAYVFVRAGTTWTQQAKLTAGDGAANDNFGFSVSLSGDTALAGAPWDDVGNNTNQGSASVFVRAGTTWTQQAKLTANDGAANDSFGANLAVSGDTVLVGAFQGDVGTNTNQGAAYVFVRAGPTWTQQAKLTASDGAANDYFGCSVSVSGDTALVGAFYKDVGINTDQGSAYVFVRAGATWTQQAQLTAADGAANDAFGSNLAIAGDTALVGAFQDDVGTNTDQGSAYVFVRSGTTWTQQVKLTAGDGAAGDVFGTSVSIAGDTALVGSPGAGGIAPYGNAQEGAAYFGRLLFANGTACTSAGQCGSGFCVDGVCCNTACGGGATNDCRVCSAAAGAASNGTCAPTNGNACFDGLTCTTADVCVSGTCTGGASPCLTGTSCTEGGSGGYSCSACPAGTFSADGTGRSACTPCVSGSWSAAGATSCAPWKSCALGSYVSTAASTSADRVCAACAAGSFSSSPNQSTCLPWSTCASTEFESSAGSPTVDRTCTACRRCAPEDVEVTACTANSDTVCAPVLDAGTPDAGAADAGTADAGVSPSPPPATGCGCVAAGTEPRGHGASLSLIGFGLLVSLRRRARSG
jgi:hypothetical protein